MTLLDTMLCVSLAMHIHGTDKSVRMVAKRCLPCLDAEDKRLVNNLINSKKPMQSVKAFVASIPEHILKAGSDQLNMSPIPFSKKPSLAIGLAGSSSA